jgi:lipopolysaccharide transport system ATP-binding protein
MAGQLLGISSEDIARLMPDIEAFAEIGDYINQPVRVYSSGMQMRLAFSVATAIRPDILIVDEALSVGDAYFVHKSFARIQAFREQGTTLLIVSHDKSAIQTICDRAILLNAGRVAVEGEPEVVIDYYNAMLADHQIQHVKQVVLNDGKVQTISGSGEVILENIALLDEQLKPLDVIGIGQAVVLQVTCRAKESIPSLTVGFMVKDRTGQAVFGTNTHYLNQSISELHKGECITLRFHFDANFGEGSYSMAIALHSGQTHVMKNYEWRDLAIIFNILNLNKPPSVGTAWLPIHKIELIR